MSNKNPLFDETFLNNLTLYRERELYARITALTKDELPIEFIQGKVTGGSINIDGTSAVRRTCSLTMIAQDVNINDFYWGLKNKFKLEIGIKNVIDMNYPDIIWFKQGIYVITSFSTSQSTSNFTINISGKDKMCLLNGDISGVLPHSTDFGTEEVIDKDTGLTKYNQIPIKTIIREIVQNFGGEMPHNIIINDLEDAGLMLLEYRGNVPFYILHDVVKDQYTNIRMDGNIKCYIYHKDDQSLEGPYSLDNKDGFIVYDTLSNLVKNNNTSIITFEPDPTATKYTVAKFEYGMIPGYRSTDLTYAGDLIANVGESLTSVLDKVRNMLGNFEYFYDINGKFVFRKKLNYVTTPWNSSESDNEVMVDAISNINAKIFSFMNGHLITSFSNTPNLLNLRNDFSVWGKYKSITGNELPIHMRYAVNKKPVKYIPIRPLKSLIVTTKNTVGMSYTNTEIKYFDGPGDDLHLIEGETIVEKDPISNITISTTNYYLDPDFPMTSKDYDWRELLYQMALDYRRFSHDDDFIYRMNEKNPDFPYGRTGYETYYTDIEGFWRDLYNFNPPLKFAAISQDKAKKVDILYLNGFRKLTGEEKKEASIENINSYYSISQSKTILTPNERGIATKLLDQTAIIDDVEMAMSRGDVVIYKNQHYVWNNQWELLLEYDKNKDLELLNPATIFPFKKGYCQLIKGEKYYYMTTENVVNQGTTDIKSLQDVGIDNIYILDGVDTNLQPVYKKFIEVKLNEALQNNDVYIMAEKIKYTDMIKNEEVLKSIFTNYPETIKYQTTDNFGCVISEAEFTIKTPYFEGYYDYYTSSDKDKPAYWRKDATDNPESLIFWFDFLDADGTDMGKYSVSAIGTRSKAINDDDVKTIYYRDIPNIIFKSSTEKTDTKNGYSEMQLPAYMENLFIVSSKGKSAKERIDELLYDHLFCTESVNISAVPVYHLEPNGKVFIQDDKSGINGEYIISKITLPLAYNGTMSLSAIKTTPSDMLIF